MRNPLANARILFMCLACLGVLVLPLRADLLPKSSSDLLRFSQLVVVGKVVGLKITTERAHNLHNGFGDYDWAIDLTIEVRSIEKGQLSHTNPIIARGYRIKSRKSLNFDDLGNFPIPGVGAEVRAHLYRRPQERFWRVVVPNGFVSASGEDLADAPAVKPLRHEGFTYWLPLELWVLLVLVGCLLPFVIVVMVRFLRRRHPARAA